MEGKIGWSLGRVIVTKRQKQKKKKRLDHMKGTSKTKNESTT